MLRLSSYWRLPSRPDEGVVCSVSLYRLIGPAVALLVFTAAPLAQEAAPLAPAPAPAIALPQVDVTTDTVPKKKTAKAKTAGKKTPAVATPATPVQSAGAAGGAAGEGGTKPGLNLDVPTETGSRLGITPLETPASVEIIPGETIKERKQTTVTQAVTQDATGFTSTASPGNGGTGLSARGFTGHNSVMQLYDGTRLYVGSGTVTFPINTWSAERIEVLRGPASVLYGEGAIGGVINLVPKKPTDYFMGEGEVAIGTDGMRRFGAGAGGPVSDQLSYRLDVSGMQSNGWMDAHAEFDSLALSGAVSYRPLKELKFTLSHDYADQNPMSYWGTPLINGRIPDSLRFKSFNVNGNDTNFVDNWTQLKTEWSPNEWFSLSNVAYRLGSDRHWRNVETYDYQEGGANAGLVERTAYGDLFHDEEQFGNRLDATFRTKLGGETKNELVVGFDVNKIKLRHTNNNNTDRPGTPPNPVTYVDPLNPAPGSFVLVRPFTPAWESHTSQYALFAEDRLTLTKELSLVAGIRLDRPSIERNNLRTGVTTQRDYSDTPWRVGAVFTPMRDLVFYGQYSTGIDSLGNLISLSETQLFTEMATGRQYEVGVKQSFWNGLGEWTLAAYDIEKKNLLSRDPNDRNIVRQIGAQSSRGIEASVALQITDSLRYEGNAAVLEAQYDQFSTTTGGFVDFAGKRPPNVPQQVVNNWLSWAFMPQWEGHVGVQWVGTMYNDDANLVKRPTYTVVNLGLDYEITEKNEVSFWLFNAFDEVYATGGNATEWQLAAPRSAELSYRIKY